ncbi:MAG: hypothetical protein KJ626_03950 [Verrucomicrobia bacterium]|nr:hypothetical protein [Verrucomicrobiota bacterium]
MSMWKIAKFLKITGSLDGMQREEERWFSIPGQNSASGQRLWSGVADSMFFDGENRYPGRSGGRYYSRLGS